jgi:hypothetical protein
VGEDQRPTFVKLRHPYTESTLEVGSSLEVVAPLELGGIPHTRCASKEQRGQMGWVRACSKRKATITTMKVLNDKVLNSQGLSGLLYVLAQTER